MNEIIRLMVGRELTNLYPPKNNKIGEPLLQVEHMSGEYTRLYDVSFTANKGEVLGIAGLDGSGRTELLENLFGVATRRSGEIFLNGKKVKKQKSPAIHSQWVCTVNGRTARDGYFFHLEHPR